MRLRVRRKPSLVILQVLSLLGLRLAFLQGRLGTWNLQATSEADVVPEASFHFDALAVPEQQRQRWISSLTRQMGLAEKLQVSQESVDEYLEACLQNMPKNPYHGPAHVLDVLQFLTTLLRETGLDEVLSPLQSSALLLAAAAHDVDHTGTSNALLQLLDHEFLEDVEDGVGPMESHSARKATALMKEHLAIEEPLASLVRRAIHGTDLAQHPRILGGFTDALEEGLEPFFQPSSEQSVLLLQIILKASDVSNPARPIHTARAWNSQVYQEFYAEGDQVLSSGGVPNPLHDRRTNCIPKSSVGFINFHVKCIFLALHDFLTRGKELGLRPEGLEPILARLEANALEFQEEAEEAQKVKERVPSQS